MMKAIKVFGAGMLVYLTLAACAASEHGTSLTDPVTNVHASDDASVPSVDASVSASVETTEVFCDKTIGNLRYAEASYPGVTAYDLASQVTAVVRLTDAHDVPPSPEGYTMQVHPLAWIRDGAVTAVCGSADTPTFPFVTFVRRGAR